MKPNEDVDDQEAADRSVAPAGLLSLTTRTASILLAGAVGLMTAQVILRFGFNSPKAWAEEVVRYLFIWSVFLGSLIALMRGTHIRVTFLIELAGPKFEAVSLFLGRIAGLLSFVFVAYFGFGLAYDNKATEFYTLPFMPMVIFYLSVPICMSLMAVYLLWPRRAPPSASAPPSVEPKP